MELLNNQYVHDFNERTHEDKQMSSEDMRFLNIVRCYILKEQATLPNNVSMGKQNLLGLKRKFKNTQAYSLKSSVKVMQRKYLSTSWTVKKERSGISPTIYHPKKSTLHVVFDCGVTFNGTSLNSQFLQGPNLPSSLLGVLTRFRQEPGALMGVIQQMF